jgi:HEAT repeat protein
MMKQKAILAIFLAGAAGATTARAQVPQFSYVQSKSGGLSKTDELYNQGTKAMNESRWSDAVVKFDEVAKAGGSRAAAALYWKAYSLSKRGSVSEALEEVRNIRTKYPSSRWRREADVLEAQMRGSSAAITAIPATPATPAVPAIPATPGTPAPPRGPKPRPSGCGDDDDLRLLALNQLMDRDPARAIPLVERFLQGNACVRDKKNALFVLSQSNSPAAKELLGRIAHGQVHPEVQREAIQSLGVSGDTATLRNLYKELGTYEAKRAALEAYGIAGDKQGCLEVAQTEQDPKLQRKAIECLGISGGKEQLRGLYKSMNSYEAKRAVLDAYIISGDTQAFYDVAVNETDPKLKRKAIEGLGINGAHEELRTLYKQLNDYESKRAVLDAYGISGDREACLAVAKSETDPKLQRRAIDCLGVAGAKSELRQLYKELNSYEAKRAVLDAFIVSGDSEAFMQVAQTETDPKLRRKAIEGIGINGGKGAGTTLVNVYANAKDEETKRAALEALFISDNAKALVELAKKETDPQLRRRIVEKLAVMDDKEATDYMLEILDKQ